MPDVEIEDYSPRNIKLREIGALLRRYDYLSGILGGIVQDYSSQRDRWQLLEPGDLRLKNAYFLSTAENAADMIRLARKRSQDSDHLSDADKDFLGASLNVREKQLPIYHSILRRLQAQLTLEPPDYVLAFLRNMRSNQRPAATDARMHRYQV